MIGVTGIFALVIVVAVLWAVGALLLGALNAVSDLFATVFFAVVLVFLAFTLGSIFRRAIAGALPSARIEVVQVLGLKDVVERSSIGVGQP
jgi:hypothetical protein